MYTAGQLVKVNTPSGVNLRESPSTQSAVLVAIPNGTVIPVIGSSVQGFANVEFAGKRGFAWEEYLAYAQQADTEKIAPGDYTIIGSNVNLRQGPSLNAPIITMSGPIGEIFTADGQAQDGFAHGEYGGKPGWMAQRYLVPKGTPIEIIKGQPVGPEPIATTPPSGMPKPTPVSQTSGGASGGAIAAAMLALAGLIYYAVK